MKSGRKRLVRLTRIAVVVSTLLLSATAFAQGWIEYRDEAERFGVSLPGQPAVRETTYTSWRGAILPVRVYTVQDGASHYSVTVVNYASDEDVVDVNGSIAYEAWKIRERGGEITYDAYATVDYIEGHELYITNADETRTLVGLFLHGKRLYILEATVPRGAAPPLLFQQSLHILDEKGVRVRYTINADGQRIARVPSND
jgi:hypothetical protein